MYKNYKKTEAIKLRKEGYTYAYISSRLSVAKSTLSSWLSGKPFIPNGFTKKVIFEGRQKAIEYKRIDKILSLKEAIEYAEKNIMKLSQRDIFILGIGIYIGEGSKSNNFVRVTNSDPRILKFMLKWFKICFRLENSNFKVRIHIYPDNDKNVVLKFWKEELKLSENNFHPFYIDTRLNKKTKNKNILPYGTAHLSIVGGDSENSGVLLHRKILASIDRVFELSKKRD